MVEKFLRNPQTNLLALVVLVVLAIGMVSSLMIVSRDESVSLGKNRYTKILLAVALLGLPSSIDLLLTDGVAWFFSLIVFSVLTLSITILVFQLSDKTSLTLVKIWSVWLIPSLLLGGLAISGYFIYLKSVGGPVVCGPLPGCGDVYNSRYATLFGFISMGWFGLLGYTTILLGWLLWQYGPVSLSKTAAIVIWGLSVFGVIFSIYLTFLEPFVIGATCMWCITSAIFMLLLLLLSTPAAQQAFVINENPY